MNSISGYFIVIVVDSIDAMIIIFSSFNIGSQVESLESLVNEITTFTEKIYF